MDERCVRKDARREAKPPAGDFRSESEPRRRVRCCCPGLVLNIYHQSKSVLCTVPCSRPPWYIHRKGLCSTIVAKVDRASTVNPMELHFQPPGGLEGCAARSPTVGHISISKLISKLSLTCSCMKMSSYRTGWTSEHRMSRMFVIFVAIRAWQEVGT